MAEETPPPATDLPAGTEATDGIDGVSPQDALVHQPKGAIASLSTLNTHLEQLAQEVLQLKLAALEENSAADTAIKQLQGRLWWLRGTLILVTLLFGGVMAWQAVSLRQQRTQLVELQTTVSSLDIAQPEQVQQLSDRLEALLEEVPDDLLGTLADAEADLASLQTDVDVLNSTIGERQKALVVLTEALQALVSDDGQTRATTAGETRGTTAVTTSPQSAADEADEVDEAPTSVTTPQPPPQTPAAQPTVQPTTGDNEG